MAQYKSQFAGAEIDERLGKVPGLAADVEELKKNGVGTPGEDGGYYRPNVDAGGNLTFTPSKSSMPYVAGVNVTGPKGEDGTSVKITNVSTSSDPGGTNSVTFSDGTVLTTKNGNNGKDLTEGAYMPSEDPTGTGALSVNRLAGSAVGEKSSAIGFDCSATAKGAAAEGALAVASGYGAHAEGVETESSGAGSHAEGRGTKATANYQHVEGAYNAEGVGYLHILGCGTSSTDRKNAHTIDKNGNAWFRGDIFIGGEGQGSGTNIKDLIPSGGEAGKSAYQYAVEGGYKGTEEEFAKKLAIEEDWYATMGETDRIMDATVNKFGDNIPLTMADFDGVEYVNVYFEGNWYNNLPVKYTVASTGTSAWFGVDDLFHIQIAETDGITYPALELYGTGWGDSFHIIVDAIRPTYNKMPEEFLPDRVVTVIERPNPWMRINITKSGTSYAADKTFDEIVAAISEGTMPYLYFDDETTDTLYVLYFERQLNLYGNPYRLLFALHQSGWAQGYVDGYIQINSDDEVTFNLGTV